MNEEYFIDLTSLYSNTEEELKIEEKVSYSQEFLENSGILGLEEVEVTGKIVKNPSEELELIANIKGTMILEDSISLDPVKYPFSFSMDEILTDFLKSCENTLDLKEFLWENIVLEIPLKFTKVTDLSEFHGDGWALLSEETRKKQENPFSELLKDFGEEL